MEHRMQTLHHLSGGWGWGWGGGGHHRRERIAAVTRARPLTLSGPVPPVRTHGSPWARFRPGPARRHSPRPIRVRARWRGPSRPADPRPRRSVHRVSRRPVHARAGSASGPVLSGVPARSCLDWPSRPCRVADYAWQRNTAGRGCYGARRPGGVNFKFQASGGPSPVRRASRRPVPARSCPA